jgi:para-aminobenzoate synthetase/4-amino-4-deoxychorismate lyase
MTQYTQLPETIHALVGATPGSVLLETSRFDAENDRSYLFLDPLRVLSAQTPDELPTLFAQIESALDAGCFIAGFLSYESGYSLQGIAGDSAHDLPLGCFGVYREPSVFDHNTGSFSGPPLPALPQTVSTQQSPAFTEGEIALSLTPEDYRRKIEQIKEQIAAGATYQVNFTDRIRLRTTTSPADLYLALRRQQPVAYGALVNLAGRSILSFSPELFFRVRDRQITTRPMKGTWPRGLDAAEDALAALALHHDEKNRSEHIMIVDLLRNDLGRICSTGSIRVDGLFSVEHYPTLLQMTSTVSGTLAAGIRWHEIFRSLFPSGSITGAPKISTMRIIRELEDSPRGIYTGAIGFIAPTGDACFNVAIRTLMLESFHSGSPRMDCPSGNLDCHSERSEESPHFDRSTVTMGVGGGIVYDSDPAAEYAECRLKAAFLTRAQPSFELIETLLWRDGYALLLLHLDRLRLSCEYFDRPFDAAEIELRLHALAATFAPLSRHRVRLTLDQRGQITLTHAPLAPNAEECRVTLAAERTSSTDVFLRHKTTHRPLYDRLFAATQQAGFDEVLFRNQRDEVTEGAISNIFLRIEGRLYTPPLACGVLPGVFRRHLLEAVPRAEERILKLADLEAADELYLCNSVRGLRRITHLDSASL